MDVMSNHNVELSQEAMNFHNVESVRCDPIGLTSVGALALFFFITKNNVLTSVNYQEKMEHGVYGFAVGWRCERTTQGRTRT